MMNNYENLQVEDFKEDIIDQIFVRNLVQKLSSDKIAVTSLKFSDSFTTEEMSEILGISTGTVWSRYNSALKQLGRLAEGLRK